MNRKTESLHDYRFKPEWQGRVTLLGSKIGWSIYDDMKSLATTSAQQKQIIVEIFRDLMSTIETEKLNEGSLALTFDPHGKYKTTITIPFGCWEKRSK